MNWKNILWGILVLDLVGVNATAGYLFYKSEILNPKHPSHGEQINSNIQIPNIQNNTVVKDECGEECKKYIDEKLAIKTTPMPTQKTVSKTKTRKEELLTIPSSGSTTANDWTDISGAYFYFDTRDWPGIQEVYFEANIKLFNGNGLAYVRLFDATNLIVVTGS